jgi:chromosome segregation ATPase
LSKLQDQQSQDQKKEKQLKGKIEEGNARLTKLKGDLSSHASKISACQREIATYQQELQTLQNS